MPAIVPALPFLGFVFRVAVEIFDRKFSIETFL